MQISCMLPSFRLDYAGIAFMIMGSFTPCIYYGFYCLYYHKIAYLTSEIVLGISSIIVALWDKFATPAFRAIRAGKLGLFYSVLLSL